MRVETAVLTMLLTVVYLTCPLIITAQFMDLLNPETTPVSAGFGFNSKGGKGGKIIKVTNLNSTGPGSLAEALNRDFPRIVVFEVAGIIDLQGTRLVVEHPYLTLAGQTAPSPGITIIRGGLSIPTHDVIVQHIRIRPGEAGHGKKSGWEVDGIAANGYNIVIDHCSISWATDENISPSGPRFQGANVEEWRQNTAHEVLISNCIIAQCLSNSTHAKGEHSKGSLVHDNATGIAIVRNLYASNMRRNPLFKGGSQGVFVNNYVFNPGRNAVHYHLQPHEWGDRTHITGKMSVVGNVIEFGPDTSKEMPLGFFRGAVNILWKDNQTVNATNNTGLVGDHNLTDKAPVWPSGLVIMPATEVRHHVLENAGARPWDRDLVDRKIIEEVRSGSNRIIDSELEVGGYPKSDPATAPFEVEAWDLNNLTEMQR